MLGKCILVGRWPVEAAGHRNSATVLPLNISSVVMPAGPSAVITLRNFVRAVVANLEVIAILPELCGVLNRTGSGTQYFSATSTAMASGFTAYIISPKSRRSRKKHALPRVFAVQIRWRCGASARNGELCRRVFGVLSFPYCDLRKSLDAGRFGRGRCSEA